MPLGQAQAQAAAAQQFQQQQAVTNQLVPPQAAVPALPPVVVDLDLDDISDEPFTPQTFRLGGIVYTLQLDDDNLLTELGDFEQDGNLDLDELHRFFFTETFAGATDSNGQNVPDGLNRLLAEIMAVDENGKRKVSLRKRGMITETAVSKWADELTDTSMRPTRRNRSDRRRSKRR
jgi:hypothetical protein